MKHGGVGVEAPQPVTVDEAVDAIENGLGPLLQLGVGPLGSADFSYSGKVDLFGEVQF